MITLVTGGSGSGKSEYGESLILDMNHPLRYYVATMEVIGAEGLDKVRRHRQQRRGKGFITLECPVDLGAVRLERSKEGEGMSLLLECVSNLAANEMFGKGYRKERHAIEELAGKLCRDIASLAAQAEDSVIITNEVGRDGGSYEGETLDYIRLMGLLNGRLADMADRVVEVVYGLPLIWKDPGLCR